MTVLLLSRKCGQSIVINDDIVVTIVAVDRNRVQIGIQAPGYVPIFRQEIVERMVADGEIEPLACLHRRRPSPVVVVAAPRRECSAQHGERWKWTCCHLPCCICQTRVSS